MLQPYCPTAHAATAAFARASNTETPPGPAALESGGHTEGMNWKTPAAPEIGFWACGLRPDSSCATQSAFFTVEAPSGEKYCAIRTRTSPPDGGGEGGGL